MFEPATHGLLDYPSTDRATRKCIKYVQVKAINKKSFHFLFQQKIRHIMDMSHFRLINTRYPVLSYTGFYARVKIVLERGLIKFLQISVSCRQTE